MIWERENIVTHKIDTWYSKELIDEIKKLCMKRPYQTLDKIVKLIKDAENET